jgi:hypothetical protein
MKREDFKYSAVFTSKASVNLGNWKKAQANKQMLASASLEDLRPLLPSDDVINDDSDLLYTAFNAAVVNLINANDHGIGTETALAVSKYFVKRHLNLEHDRWSVIGHIITQGYSTFGENKLIEESELVGTKEPFNICLGGIVYKLVREYIADFIEESADPESDWYQDVSASWEIGFNEFDIVLGSKKLSDAQIVSDPQKIAEYTKYLRMEGGEGFLPDGTPVYCLIKGKDARPLGCALTTNPAAAVKGLLIPEPKDDETDPEMEGCCSNKSNASEDKIASLELKIETLEKELKEKKEKFNDSASQNKKTNVTKINMKINSIKDITSDFLKEAEASDLKDFITSQLETKANEFNTTLAAEKAEKDKLEAEAKVAKEESEKLQKELDKLKAEASQKEKQEKFNVRMDELANKFELSDAQKSVVASQIKDLDDSKFEDWKNQFALFAKVKVAEETDEQKQEALKNATASNVTLPNAQSPSLDEIAELAKGLSMFSVKSK